MIPMTGVIAKAAEVKLNTTSISIRVKQTYQLKVTGSSKTVTWSSSNKKVVTVDNKGKIKGVKKGSATITAKVSGKKYEAKITVVDAITANDFYFTGSTTLEKGFMEYCDDNNYTSSFYYFDDIDGDYNIKSIRGIKIGSSKSDVIKKYGYAVKKALNPQDDMAAKFVKLKNDDLNGLYELYYNNSIDYYEYSFKKDSDTYRIRFLLIDNKVGLVELTKNAQTFPVSTETGTTTETTENSNDAVYVEVEYMGATWNDSTNKLDLTTAFQAVIRSYSADIKKIRESYTENTASSSYDYLIYKGTSKTLTIPEKINGVTVTGFTAHGESAGDSYYDGVETLVLPSTVTYFCWVTTNADYGDLKKVIFKNSKKNVEIKNSAPKGIEVEFDEL